MTDQALRSSSAPFRKDDDRVEAIIAQLPRPWVCTSGVFDLIHPGHTMYLREAARIGASLIVGVNSDASVRMLGKGPDRPFMPESARHEVVSSLEPVSLAIIFDEETPISLLKFLRPDYFVKGGDYEVESLPEFQARHDWGGEVLCLSRVDSLSTTEIIQRIRSGTRDSGGQDS